MRARSSTASAVGKIALAAWFALLLLVGAGLLAKHLLALPAPARSAQLGAKLSQLRSPSDGSRWLAVHVLYAECRCSQRIVDHLVADRRPSDWTEVVLWVGALAPDPALARRARIVRVDRQQLAAFGVEAAPLLVAIDPSDRVRYSGGYTTRKQGPDIQDVRILDGIRRSDLQPLAQLPIFGCAVSERLQRELSILPTP